MNMDQTNVINEILAKKNLEYEDGLKLQKAISLTCNSLDFHRIISAYTSAAPKGKKRLRLLAAMVGHCFAMERMQYRSCTWDKRKKASEEFAFLHDDVFYKMLRDEGIISSNMYTEYYPYLQFTREEAGI